MLVFVWLASDTFRT